MSSAVNQRINAINTLILTLIDEHDGDLESVHVDYEAGRIQYVGVGVPRLFFEITRLVSANGWVNITGEEGRYADGNVTMLADSYMVEVELAEHIMQPASVAVTA